MRSHPTLNRRRAWGTTRRRGVVLVECAFVYPLTLLLLMGLLVLGIGVFRHQQLTLMAREGARWAAVRRELNPTSTMMMDEMLNDQLAGIDRASFQPELTFEMTPDGIPTYTVRLSYNWSPLGLFGPFRMRGVATMPVWTKTDL